MFEGKGKRERGKFTPRFLSETMGYIAFKDLKVWQIAMDLVDEVYKLTKMLPKEETFGLSLQIRRAVVSVPSNIAEGNSRHSIKEYINFLSIARGSNSEFMTQLLICKRLGYFNAEQVKIAEALSDEISKMLNAMIAKLQNK